MLEIWKDIPNYEGIYQVSNLGNVKSFRKNKELILKQLPNTRGYLRVGLYDKNNKTKTIPTHVLVAMAFLGHKPNKTQEIVVDHINNNKLDNSLTNLQLITNRENSTKEKKGKSKYAGVSFIKSSQKWRAVINYKNRTISLGCFFSEYNASQAYKEALFYIKNGFDLNSIYPKTVKSSKYKGISYCSDSKKWRARYNKKCLGRYDTEELAYKAILKITTFEK
jgi:hypothetical protein